MILKKEGSPDISVDVCRTPEGDFTAVVNGVEHPVIRRYSSRQVITGDTPRMTLDDAWRSVLSKYPGYSAAAEED